MLQKMKRAVKKFWYCFLITKTRFIQKGSLSIGDNSNISLRVKISIGKGAKLVIGKGVVIDEYTKITVHPKSTLIIGDSVYISFNSLISSNSKVEIGNDTQIAHFVTVLDTNHTFASNKLRINQQGGISKPIFIGEDVWVAAGVIILPGVQIGNHSILAANSVVNKDVPESAIVGGVPSKVIKFRNE